MKMFSEKKAQLKIIMYLIVGLFALAIILSIFIGGAKSGLLGKTGEAADKAVNFGVFTIGKDDFKEVSIQVPDEINTDFMKFVDAFNDSKDISNCYVKLGRLENFRNSEFIIGLIKSELEGGTYLVLQKLEGSAIVNIKGKRYFIKDNYPCGIFGPDGTVPENFVKKYLREKEIFSGYYSNFGVLQIFDNGKMGDIRGAFKGIAIDLINENSILVKPEGHLSCLVPTFNIWSWKLKSAVDTFRGIAGKPGLRQDQLDKIVSGNYPGLQECSQKSIDLLQDTKEIEKEYVLCYIFDENLYQCLKQEECDSDTRNSQMSVHDNLKSCEKEELSFNKLP